MRTTSYAAFLFAIVVGAAISTQAMILSDGVRLQSVTRVDDLEVLGTTEAAGELTALSGVRLTTPVTGPLVTSGTGSPDGVVSATLGSMYLQTDSAATFQNTDGVTTWTELGGATVDGWQLVVDDPLTGGALTGWTQRNGAWSANGTGFHNTGGGECYLSYESGGFENAPFPMDGVIMEFEALWPAGSGTTELLGAVIVGLSATVATGGTTRFFMRRDGTLMGASGYPSSTASINPGLGTLATDTWFTFRAVLAGNSVALWFNGTFYGTFSVTITYPAVSVNTPRVGLWSNGRGSYRNLKIYRRVTPP